MFKIPPDIANPPTDVVRLIPVIQNTCVRRGKGTEDSPLRIVTQYFSVDGELLAEKDPVLEQRLQSEREGSAR